MKGPATLAVIAVLTAACGSGGDAVPSPLSPALSAPVPPRPSSAQILVGQQVQAMLVGHGSQDSFELTASSTGTLVVRVTWGPQALIALRVGAHWVAQTSSSPLIARVEVIAGEKYQLGVADGAAWDYGDFVLPYSLTTTIEAPTPRLR